VSLRTSAGKDAELHGVLRTWAAVKSVQKLREEQSVVAPYGCPGQAEALQTYGWLQTLRIDCNRLKPCQRVRQFERPTLDNDHPSVWRARRHLVFGYPRG
jgi:hypothetical protein